MTSLDELNNAHKNSTNNTAPQTPAEKLEAMRPKEPIPPRVIIHSYDPSTGNKPKQTANQSDSLCHKDD